MKRYVKFPQSCIGCPSETPTGLCEKLFDIHKFQNGKSYEVRATKRRKDCPLSEDDLVEQPSGK